MMTVQDERPGMDESKLRREGEIAAPARSTSRGRWLVVGLLLFGSLATAGISTYWKVRLGPFSPYRRALKAAFPDGAPVVEGGNLPGQPSVLRVVLRVGFSPTAEDARVQEVADQVQTLANEIDTAGRYDKLVLYLMKPRPQQKPERLELTRPLHATTTGGQGLSPEPTPPPEAQPGDR
ncbi:MAG: hypothetical protein ACKOGA_12870 [Planctomycetaceae bacterium]